MKRPLIVVIFLLIPLLAVVQVWAAPLAQEPRPVIAQPEENSAVRGVVQIVGSAVHPQFQRYELYYAPSPVPSDQAWIFIGDAHFQQQPLGLLGTWDSKSVPDGTYALRVRVVKQDGNYNDSEPRRVLVANTSQVATATPAATEAAAPTAVPTGVPTELPATATIIVDVPAIETPTPIATSAPTPSPTPILASGATGSTSLADVEEILSPTRLFDVASKAATYTVGFFVLVGLFFALKALLVWLIHLIRP